MDAKVKVKVMVFYFLTFSPYVFESIKTFDKTGSDHCDLLTGWKLRKLNIGRRHSVQMSVACVLSLAIFWVLPAT